MKIDIRIAEYEKGGFHVSSNLYPALFGIGQTEKEALDAFLLALAKLEFEIEVIKRVKI